MGAVIAPGVRNGFPFVIPIGKTWDNTLSPASFNVGDAVIAPWSLASQGEFSVNQVPVNADGSIPVGTGTRYSIQLTLAQAMQIYWRVRKWTLSLNFTLAVPGSAYTEDFVFPDIEVEMGGSVAPNGDSSWQDPVDSPIKAEADLVVSSIGRTQIGVGTFYTNDNFSTDSFLMNFELNNSDFVFDSSGNVWWSGVSVIAGNDYPVFPVFYGAPGVMNYCGDGYGMETGGGYNYQDSSQYDQYTSTQVGSVTLFGGLTQAIMAFVIPPPPSSPPTPSPSLTFNEFTFAPSEYWTYGGLYDADSGDYTG